MEGLGARPVDTLDKRTLRFVGSSDRSNEHLQSYDVDGAPEVHITDLKYIGSYNWTDEWVPTIVVPGSPRIWKPVAPPYTLQNDFAFKRGKPSFLDQNGYRLPSSPTLPLFKSVDAVCALTGAASPDWSAIDVITDRNGLRKLMRWATGSSRGKEFRIDVDLAGRQTVVMTRWEARTAVRAQEISYGHSFEHYNTKAFPGCGETTSHHRVITYEFNGMQMIVRFEVDACLPLGPNEDVRTPLNTTGFDSNANPFPTDTTTPPPMASDSLPSAVSSQQLRFVRKNATKVFTPKDEPAPTLIVRHGGVIVPQTHIAELKSRANINWAELAPQLFLSQTPHHFNAQQDAGTVTRVRTVSADELASHEGAVQPALRRLREALGAIQKRVVEHGRGARLSLVCRNRVLWLYEREGANSMLPEGILKRFEC